MVKGSEVGILGAAGLQHHGLPVGSETLHLLFRVPRAAARLQMQPEEPVVAGHGPAKTATLTQLVAPQWLGQRSQILDGQTRRNR